VKTKTKNTKSCTGLEVLKVLAVASAVLGALAILYFSSLSLFSLATGAARYSVQGHRYGYRINASLNSSTNSTFNMPAQNGTAPYFPGAATRYGIAGAMQAHVFGLFSGILMVLLGVVTLKYAKLRMKVSAS